MSNIYFRIQYDLRGRNFSDENNRIVNSDCIKDARLAIFDGKLIKPYFSDNDIALNSLVKSSLN
jgi:hypothetical protein